MGTLLALPGPCVNEREVRPSSSLPIMQPLERGRCATALAGTRSPGAPPPPPRFPCSLGSPSPAHDGRLPELAEADAHVAVAGTSARRCCGTPHGRTARTSGPRAAPEHAGGGRVGGALVPNNYSSMRPRTTPRHSPACRTSPRDLLPCPRRGGSRVRRSRRTMRSRPDSPRIAPFASPRGRRIPIALRGKRQRQPLQFGIENLREFLALFPAHGFDGALLRVVGTNFILEVARILTHHGLPQRLRTGRVKHPETGIDRDQVPRALGEKTPFLILGRAHPERAGWNPT